MNIIEQVVERLSVFKNLYDIIRIVDPVNKKSIIMNEDTIEKTEGSCFRFLKKDSFCDNCVSMRAFVENDTFVKIVYHEGKVFLMTATPLFSEGKTYIVEMLKDISDTGKINIDSNASEKSLEELINEMNEKIIKDDLTGVYNRRYINERLPIDINNSIINNTPLSIIMADIDYFKKINDSYGHAAGDKVLKDFSSLVSNCINEENGWVARYGGEEFLFVVNNAHDEKAFKVAEKIRKLVDQTIFNYEGIHMHITSSFGVYSFQNKNLDINKIISLADKNLYRAKLCGRNKTIAE